MNFKDIGSYIMGSLFNIIVFAATIFFVIVISTKAFKYGQELVGGENSRTDNSGENVTFVLPEGASTKEVAKILEENELIDNDFIFLLQVKLNGTDRYIRSGEYTLSKGISANDLMEELQKAPLTATNEEKITIQEGLSIVEMAEYIEKEYGFFTKDEFLAACKNTSLYEYEFIDYIPEREYLLEGYLFPDTYFLPENPKPEHLIARMLSRFEEVFDEYIARASEMGLTTDQVVTIASIIEKEIKLQDERSLAASVIHRRLQKDMPLQMCSTVLYALGTTRDKLLLSDLQVESSYNTYIHAGLPPGPIAAPGKASIEAAIYPNEENEYLYFVLQDPETGKHYFTSDYDDFLHAKELYNDEF